MSEPSPKNGRRTFIAVPLPQQVRAALFEACQELAARHLPQLKWARKVENLHLTIRFLGNIGDAQLVALGSALAGRMALLPPFPVTVCGIGAFPSARQAAVIWAGLDDPTGGLTRIASEVAAVTHELDLVDPDPRPFRAHVTLGRSREGVDLRPHLPAWVDRRFGHFTGEEVHLYESRLGREGSTYLLRATALLAG